ncbi:hypothetical protein DPMN_042775 [Dreissena polymorpha]|uniref:Uncharacterized protein n=1 Tax=Dreissena polymorpha TaxID=45954 RepID=A0A9D4D142_DREPO|nr:hypothetical protein DPMN_042775 [Dreissena polymorpha]
MQTNGTFDDFKPRHMTNANVLDSIFISATSLMSHESETGLEQRPRCLYSPPVRR